MTFTICTLIAAGGLWRLNEHLNRRRRLEGWQHTAASRGLKVEEVSSYSARQLKLVTRAGPLEVRIEEVRGLTRNIQVVVVVPALADFSDVRIRRGFRKAFSGVRELKVGDGLFDRMFDIAGPPRHVCALLDAKARALLLLVATKCRLEIVAGEIRAQTYDSQLSDVLPGLLDLGHLFSQPRDVTLCLLENARQDPRFEVRLQNLLLLVREFPGTPGTVEELRRACSDSSPKVRLWAARELGAEGRDVLRQLAASQEDDDCSAQAISALGLELPFKDARAILGQAVQGHHVQTARACLEVLGRYGTAKAIKHLVRVMTQERDELAVAAARALGTTGNAAAELPLIGALQHRITEVRVAAANGLGRLGSTAAVLPLKEAAKRFAYNPDLLKATRQAIAEIQLRLPGASPGQLSLASTEAGRLSLAQTEAGQLSLANDPAGQLSLKGETG
ncbi:MAG TPA: HEAT repeat domain-containing protein [Thermoanaerobaculia bacterium]|nr:HEAT repeat domain-containing protein [Thermoanaerobaculia bacterium]